MYVIKQKRFKKDKSREEEGGIVLCNELTLMNHGSFLMVKIL